MSKKLLLINIYPPVTMARYLLSGYQLKAYLEKHLPSPARPELVVLNFSTAASADKIAAAICTHAPTWVGYSCYMWNMGKTERIINTFVHRLPCRHILGGPEISVSKAKALSDRHVGDYYVIGEGEETLCRLIRCLLKTAGPGEVCLPPGVAPGEVCLPPGVAWRKENRLRYTAPGGSVALEHVPSVYLSGTLEDRLYRYQQAFVETQRGCANRCSYCLYHKKLPAIDYYPLDRVLKELDHLIVGKAIRALRILDADFTSDLPRAKAIARHLASLKKIKGVRLPWTYWEFNHDTPDDEFLALTAALKYRAGICNCDTLAPLNQPQHYTDLLRGYTVVNCVGVQSLDPRVNRAVNRVPLHRGAFTRFMTRAAHHNLVLKLDLVLGLPLETYTSWVEGIRWLLPFFEKTDHILNIHRLRVLPGTPLEATSAKYDIRFSAENTHLVMATNTFDADDLSRSARLSGLLFRIVNSPLRGLLFAKMRRTGGDVFDVLQSGLERLGRSKPLGACRLIEDDRVDDDYWNADIFRDVPSAWLKSFLNAG